LSSGGPERRVAAERLSPVAWLRDRIGWDGIAHLAAKKEVPVHRYTLLYYLGGMALFLFTVQVATGILLLLLPLASGRGESGCNTSWPRSPSAGSSARSTLGRQPLRASSSCTWPRSPEGVPRARDDLDLGSPVAFLALGFGFSGYLPWNTLAFFATKVGTDVPAIPGIGLLLSRILRGGSDVTGATVSFYGVHVAILPAITTALLALHLVLVQYHGMSVPPGEEARAGKTGKPVPSMPFAPHFVLRDLFGWTVALALLAGLSAFLPWELGRKADLFASAPAGIRPEWYFLWMFQALKYAPADLWPPRRIAGILFFALAAILVLVPFWTAGLPRGLRPGGIDWRSSRRGPVRRSSHCCRRPAERAGWPSSQFFFAASFFRSPRGAPPGRKRPAPRRPSLRSRRLPPRSRRRPREPARKALRRRRPRALRLHVRLVPRRRSARGGPGRRP
jgi:cytochrome b6